ncbi:MAG: (2Fe-2S)-binding protein [Candidatus Melainabacteria bacterium]|nr:(2Fe-2S)-binding protein [Candidatus Melainabacteria bacterium]
MEGAHQIALKVNGIAHTCKVESSETLAHLLRERLHLTGTKIGCDAGTCGSCTVLVNGQLRNACITLAALLDGAEVTTIEGLSDGDELHGVQQSFVDNGAIQCGFCTPGMVMASIALLKQNSTPTDAEIREAISGNICRCTGYTKIIKAIKQASSVRRTHE